MNRQIVLKSRPEGMPQQENFVIEETTVPDIREDELLVKTKYLSVDPYMRGRMKSGGSNMPVFETDKPLEGAGIAEIIESSGSEFLKGDLIKGTLQWKEIQAIKASQAVKIDNSNFNPADYLGVLGMTGLTAYFGLLEIGKPVKGETVVVSGAAGAVGNVAGQIARIKECRVIGIAGSNEKITFLKEELGFDEAVNYNNAEWQKSLSSICSGGVDIYFDNVGGEISDAVLSLMNQRGRIIICGQTSLYNSSETPLGPRVQPVLLEKKALMQGFTARDYSDQFGKAAQKLSRWIKEGKLISRQTILKGFENLPAAFIGLFRGLNTGKCLVEL